MQQFKLKSFDDTEIFVTIWDDVNAPCGVIQFLHGMSEYGGHYDEFAKYLNSRGYIVFADDHRAHGRTETDENRGKHDGDVFKKTLQDELFFREWLKDKYELPVFLMGHSYGSLIAQAMAQAGTDVKAIALLGSGHLRDLGILAKIVLAPAVLFARNWRPKQGNAATWRNSLPERLDEINKDPMAHTPTSIGFNYSMARNTSKLYSRRALAKLNPATSIGIFSGDKDPLGRNGKAVEKLYKMYLSYGINCEMHLYPNAKHEIVYEHCGKQVQEDIADFFDKFVIYEQTSIDEILEK